MKPRPAPAPLTSEDQVIWTWLCTNNTAVMNRRVAGLWLFYQAADRRDAELMYAFGIYPRVPVTGYRMLSLAAVGLELRWVRGMPAGAWEIT